jgi:hypothetical protein
MAYLAKWIPILGVACLIGAAPGGGGPTPAVAQVQDSVTRRGISLEVDNQNFYDATIYAVRPGLRQRVGYVTGEGKDTFTFRWPDGDLQVEIDLLAVGSYYTQVMDVQQGDELQLTVLPYLHTLPPGTVF